MGSWAPEGFSSQEARFYATELEHAVRKLSAKAKQAFHAAATRQEIARGTWDGCAFNAGSKELGENVASVDAAARLFEMEERDVSRFIDLWDTSKFSTDEEATRKLKQLLEDADLFADPGFAGRTFVTVVHESDVTKDKKVFDAMVEGLDISVDMSEEMQEFRNATSAASELLGV